MNSSAMLEPAPLPICICLANPVDTKCIQHVSDKRKTGWFERNITKLEIIQSEFFQDTLNTKLDEKT
jgi:hypothetical protein